MIGERFSGDIILLLLPLELLFSVGVFNIPEEDEEANTALLLSLWPPEEGTTSSIGNGDERCNKED